MTIRRSSFEHAVLSTSHVAYTVRMHRVSYCSLALTACYLIVNVTSYLVYVTAQDNRYPVYNGTIQENGYPIYNGTVQDSGYPVYNDTSLNNGYPLINGTVPDKGYPVYNETMQDNGYPVHNDILQDNGFPVHDDTAGDIGYLLTNSTAQDKGYLPNSEDVNFSSYSSERMGNITSYTSATNVVHIPENYSQNDDVVNRTTFQPYKDDSQGISKYWSHAGDLVDTNNDLDDVSHTSDLLGTSYVSNDSDITNLDPLSPDTVCPEICICKRYFADCSSHYGNLTFIPRLPLNITHLLFTHNDLTSITTDFFFSNITNITYLDLSCNGLTFISSGAFNIFTRLKTLNLSRNRLNKSNVILVLSIKTLSTLNLNVNNIRYLESEMFCPHSGHNLKTITLYDNNVKTLIFAAFSKCKDLTYLNVGDNLITEIRPRLMSSLQNLTLHHNYIGSFLKTCRNKTSSFYPNLIHLNLTANDIDAVHNVCLPSLQVLDLSFNTFTRIESYTFRSSWFPRLQILTLQSTIGTGRGLIIKRNAFSNSVLKIIILSHCRISFKSDVNVHPEAFADCPALQEINLEDNYFEQVSDSKYFKLFGNLTSLWMLNLGYNHIHSITGHTYHSLKHLRNFYLHGNLLETIPDGTFDSMTDLKILHLGGNKLKSIRETTFSEALRRRLHQIDLSQNPFECSCNIMWFRNWILSNESQFYGTSGGYRCWNIRSKLTEFYLPDQACLLSSYTFTLTVVFVSLLLITLIVAAVLYRLRWHIRLLLYETFRGRTDERRLHNLMTGNFTYDVFVSYSAEDLDWVHEHLMPELEVRMGLRLCIHQRDFIPGQNILDNIVDNLAKSKKVMLIFSTHFARSHWCQVELALCLQHVMDHDDILVVVCLENLPHRTLTSAMLAVLTITTYIQWENNADAIRSFWEHINSAFHEILVERRCEPTMNLNIFE